MGKATGFMEYERQEKAAEAPIERLKHFSRISHTFIKGRAGTSGRKMYVLRGAVLSGRADDYGNGQWMPAPQSGSGVE